MITFIVDCTNFHDAAEVEKVLKNQKINYQLSFDGRHNQTPKTRQKRTQMTPALVKDILAYIATHRDLPNTAIAYRFSVSASTIDRIRHGTHKLSMKRDGHHS